MNRIGPGREAEEPMRGVLIGPGREAEEPMRCVS
jgi:hypothetical protein